MSWLKRFRVRQNFIAVIYVARILHSLAKKAHAINVHTNALPLVVVFVVVRVDYYFLVTVVYTACIYGT